jgi:hypothetical protein
MNRMPIAQQLRERVDKYDCEKLRNFCTAKEIVTTLKRVHSSTSDKGLITRIYREPEKLNLQRINNPLNK